MVFFIKMNGKKFVLDNNFDLIGSHWFHNASIMFKENDKYFDFPFQPMLEMEPFLSEELLR